MNQSDCYPMIAKTMAELEDVLAEELIQIGASDVEIGTRMVSFTGDKALMYKANVHCRTALRILKPIHNFKAENADEVYEAIKSIDWDKYMSLDKTFAIDSVVFSHIFRHSKFVAYRVKDAIADWFQEKYGKRPSVSLTNPDLMFNIHVAHNKCTLSLDSSGESLHKRGYRIAQTDAPLNEVLAAGMIMKSGWRGESNFIDPMCGSGTLLIEAAMIATGTPPGIHRQGFGFEKWNDFDEELFSDIYNDDSTSREFDFKIFGSDVSVQAISAAEQNAKNSGMKKYIELSLMPLQQYTEAPKPVGVLMTNPPYGERLKVEDLDELYSMIGERLKHVYMGYDSYVLSYKKELFDKIGLKPSKRFFLFNGALECEMRQYEIFEGKRIEHNPDEREESAKKRERRSQKFTSQDRNSREGYRRSKQQEDFQEGDRRDNDREERPRRRDFRSSDRPRRDFDRDRRPRREFDRSDRPRRDFDKSDRPRRDFDKSDRPRRSFDKPGDREKRPFPKRESFDRDRKFDGDRRPREFKRRDGHKDNPRGDRRSDNKFPRK